MAKIAISLPDKFLESIEKECRARGETRSEFFRRAVESFLRRERERLLEEQYIRGYRQYPETAEEIAIAEATLVEALADNPWEDDTKK
jgi:metal-responsive CopG/Arc/MetJ family transcriptional regulator